MGGKMNTSAQKKGFDPIPLKLTIDKLEGEGVLGWDRIPIPSTDFHLAVRVSGPGSLVEAFGDQAKFLNLELHRLTEEELEKEVVEMQAAAIQNRREQLYDKLNVLHSRIETASPEELEDPDVLVKLAKQVETLRPSTQDRKDLKDNLMIELEPEVEQKDWPFRLSFSLDPQICPPDYEVYKTASTSAGKRDSINCTVTFTGGGTGPNLELDLDNTLVSGPVGPINTTQPLHGERKGRTGSWHAKVTGNGSQATYTIDINWVHDPEH
jgi:hypothetical protein